MASTAGITLSATVSGLPTGGLVQQSIQMANTSGAYQQLFADCTTSLAGAGSISIPSSAQFFMARAAASTNSFPWRISATTVEPGMTVTSNGIFFIRAPGNSAFRFYTTAGTTFQLELVTF